MKLLAGSVCNEDVKSSWHSPDRLSESSQLCIREGLGKPQSVHPRETDQGSRAGQILCCAPGQKRAMAEQVGQVGCPGRAERCRTGQDAAGPHDLRAGPGSRAYNRPDRRASSKYAQHMTPNTSYQMFPVACRQGTL